MQKDGRERLRVLVAAGWTSGGTEGDYGDPGSLGEAAAVAWRHGGVARGGLWCRVPLRVIPERLGCPEGEGQPGRRLASDSTLTVPFLSNVDAEVALRFLLPGADLYRGMVLWELSVTGSELFIRLTSEDAELLQISTFYLLTQLLIVARIMQHIVFPDVANFQYKRAD
ncbi:EKC/KEOPS complex subunit LAGE3-like [Phyllostomus hastatus]|uniref:EKC/KEOPS complex subunit LAGE3-like n=1 Tax=Phyllostomus hastatus TaxID=9423 RepID=UPI001E67FCB4|nr:EKC/KEOPS complex subunit LAGE3-like [Phyllostomus hastatus]